MGVNGLIEKYMMTELIIKRKLDHFNSKCAGKIIMNCDTIRGSLFCENTDFNFCRFGVESIHARTALS